MNELFLVFDCEDGPMSFSVDMQKITPIDILNGHSDLNQLKKTAHSHENLLCAKIISNNTLSKKEMFDYVNQLFSETFEVIEPVESQEAEPVEPEKEYPEGTKPEELNPDFQEYTKGLEDARREAGEHMTNLRVMYRQFTDTLKNEVIKCNNYVKKFLSNEGLCELAKITRRAEQGSLPIADDLKNVMMIFGCKEIAPATGDEFNDVRHMYASDRFLGCKSITKVIFNGWEFCNETLLSAVVEAE